MDFLKNAKTSPIQNSGQLLDKCKDPITAVVAIAAIAIFVIKDIAGNKK